jgi:hypothetical protein
MYKHVYQRVDTLLCEPMARGRFSGEKGRTIGETERERERKRAIFKMGGCTAVYERDRDK